MGYGRSDPKRDSECDVLLSTVPIEPTLHLQRRARDPRGIRPPVRVPCFYVWVVGPRISRAGGGDPERGIRTYCHTVGAEGIADGIGDLAHESLTGGEGLGASVRRQAEQRLDDLRIGVTAAERPAFRRRGL
jgi:hypothetical protein